MKLNLFKPLVAAALVVLTLLALTPAIPVKADSGQVVSRQYVITNSSTTVPVRIAPRAGTYATSITVIGNKDWQTTNTGTVYIGPSSTNGQQSIAITTGQIVTLSFTPSQWVDLYDWYLDPVTANDGVVVIYSK